MTRKLMALFGIFALCFSMMAVSAGATIVPPSPSSSAEACEAAEGEFTAGTAEIDVNGNVRTTTTIDTCIVTLLGVESVQTGHKNFRVDFDTTTVTEHSTTTVKTENLVQTGNQPGIQPTLTTWSCFNNGNQQQGQSWTTADPEDPTSDNVPSQGHCASAAMNWPQIGQGNYYVLRGATVNNGDPIPGDPIYEWVEASDSPSVTDASKVISFTEVPFGCFNLVSGKYLVDDYGINNFNNHCNTTIANHTHS